MKLHAHPELLLNLWKEISEQDLSDRFMCHNILDGDISFMGAHLVSDEFRDKCEITARTNDDSYVQIVKVRPYEAQKPARHFSELVRSFRKHKVSIDDYERKPRLDRYPIMEPASARIMAPGEMIPESIKFRTTDYVSPCDITEEDVPYCSTSERLQISVYKDKEEKEKLVKLYKAGIIKTNYMRARLNLPDIKDLSPAEQGFIKLKVDIETGEFEKNVKKIKELFDKLKEPEKPPLEVINPEYGNPPLDEYGNEIIYRFSPLYFLFGIAALPIVLTFYFV